MERIFMILCSCSILLTASQHCREYAQTCADDKDCCGGCCLKGICKDTYQDCRVKTNPCRDHYCPPEQECYVYEPLDCGGCGPSVQCRQSEVPPVLSEYIEYTYETSTVWDTNDGYSMYFNKILIILSSLFIFI